MTQIAEQSLSSVAETPALGRYFSYFSHRVYVAYRPAELHAYLRRLIVVDPNSSGADAFDAEILRWALLQRARLNPLALNREIEALRGEGMRLDVSSLKYSQDYRIDATLQFAAEIALAESDLQPWLEKRPRLYQPLLDAAYYVSAWGDLDRQPVAGTQGREARVLDLGPDGLPAFAIYLRSRMNLYVDETEPADKDSAAQWRIERERIIASALGTEDLSRLYQLALQVARMLGTCSDADGWLGYWSESIAGAPDAVSPTQEFIRTLLAGAASVLIPVPLGDTTCTKFRWRYLPSGKDSPEALADKAKASLDSIAIAQTSLSLAIGQSEDDVGEDQQILNLLAPILRARQPWSEVVKARAVIASASRGTGSPTAIEDAVTRLQEFAVPLSDRVAVSSVCHVLIYAAAMAGLAQSILSSQQFPGRSITGELITALKSVSAGLHLQTLGTRKDVVNRIAVLGKALTLLIPTLPEATLEFGGAAWPPLLATQVSEAYKRGETADMFRVIDDAWVDSARRILALLRGSTSQEPLSAAEIVSLISNNGPGHWIDADPGQMTARRWSSLLEGASRGPSVDYPVPVWMAAYALAWLGARSIGRDQQETLTEVLTENPEDQALLHQHAFEHGVLGQGGTHSRTLLVIGPQTRSITDTWTLPAKGELMLSVAASDVAALAAGLIGKWIKGVGPLRVAWEPGSATRADEARIRQALVKRFGKAFEEVWIYLKDSPGDRQPQVIDPTSAIDCWAVPSS